MTDFEAMTDKLMKGLDSEKLLYKNQQKKIERLVEANRLLKNQLDTEEEELKSNVKGRLFLPEIMTKEMAAVHEMNEIKKEFSSLTREQMELETQFEKVSDELSLCNSKIYLLSTQNDKLKTKYLRNEKLSSRLDEKVKKLQAQVMQIISPSTSTESHAANNLTGHDKGKIDPTDSLLQKRKCRSYHGSPEKMHWHKENQEAVSKAKIELELELTKLKQEHSKLSEIERFLKRKLAPGTQGTSRNDLA